MHVNFQADVFKYFYLVCVCEVLYHFESFWPRNIFLSCMRWMKEESVIINIIVFLFQIVDDL